MGTATIVGSVCWRRTIRLKNRNKLDLKCKHHVMWSGQWWRQRRSGPGPLHHGKVARKPKNNYSPGLLRGGKKRSRGHQRVGSEARTTGDTEGTAQPEQPAQRSAPANEVAVGPGDASYTGSKLQGNQMALQHPLFVEYCAHSTLPHGSLLRGRAWVAVASSSFMGTVR